MNVNRRLLRMKNMQRKRMRGNIFDVLEPDALFEIWTGPWQKKSDLLRITRKVAKIIRLIVMCVFFLSVPLEMKILSREHFNRWYKLTPYLLSVILVEIPFQVMCIWLYIAISYWLTDQPFDFRLILFVVFVTASSLCAQSMGYFIGATTPVKVAVFIAPVVACFLSVFGFCIRSYDTPTFFKPIFFISYFRAAFQSVVWTIYGLNRDKLFCPTEQEYCHYQDPYKFLVEMDILDVDLVSNIILIVVIWCLMHAATYLTLWFRLNKR